MLLTNNLVDSKKEWSNEHDCWESGLKVIDQITGHDAEGHVDAIDDKICEEGCQYYNPTPTAIRSFWNE